MAEIKDYSVTADDNDSASPNGMPEGMAPSGVNNSWRESFARVKRWYEDIQGAKTTTGSSNAYVLAAARVVTAYAAGDAYLFKANHTCTSAGSTLNVDSVGAKSIVTSTGAALGAGAITSGGLYMVVFEATADKFMLIAGSAGGSADNILIYNSSPTFTMENSTSEDTAGGRESNFVVKGLQSGSEESTLAKIEVSHDGSSDDQKGRILIYTNDGSDDAAPTQRLKIDSAGLVTVAGGLDIDGAVQIDSTVTVGVDDTGYDVKFFGDTASAYMLWDTSTDDLVLAGAAGIDLAGDIDVDGTANLDIVDIDGAVDMASTLTLAGNADFNGDLDVDGTANLDAVDIDGAVQIDATVTVGVDDTGYDVKFFGDTASAYMLWDTSADDLVLAGAAGIDLAGDLDVDGTTNLDAVDIDGAVQIDATVTVGVDDTGYDVKFFGDTASAYMLWDTSTDDLVLAGAAGLVIPDGGTIGSTSDTDAIAIRSDGNVGIGNAGNSAIALQVTGSSADTVIYGSGGGHGVYGLAGTSAGYVGVLGYAYDTAHYGFLGYSTNGVYATSVYCVGALYAASSNAAVKAFRIPHGLREGYDLIHSSIEGPQYDLIYRGKVELVNGQASIDIDSHYDMTQGTFEWLTKSDSVQTFTSNETGWDAVRSSFSGDTITIECQNSSSTDTISWMVIAERGDPSVVEGEGTDDEGNLIIERESEPEPPPPPPPLPPLPED
jgi:hypothetical protein